jgi:hypothetical protein
MEEVIRVVEEAVLLAMIVQMRSARPVQRGRVYARL